MQSHAGDIQEANFQTLWPFFLFTKEKLVDFITSSDIILLISAVGAETSSSISIFHKYFINSLTPGIWKEFGLLIPTLNY